MFRNPVLVVLLALCAGVPAIAQIQMGLVKSGNEEYAYYNNSVFSLDGNRGYVTDPQNSRVIVFDPRRAAGNILTTIPTGTEPMGIYLTPDGSYACVLNRDSHNVTIIRMSDYSTRTYTPSPIPTFTNHNNIAFTPDSQYGIVCNSATGSNSVFVFRLSNGQQAKLITGLGERPVRTYVDPTGTRAFVLCTCRTINDQIGVIRVSDLALEGTPFTMWDADFDCTVNIPSGPAINDIAFAPDGSMGYICDPRLNDVLGFGIPNYSYQPWLDINAENTGYNSMSRIAVSPDGNYLMASSIVTNRLWIMGAHPVSAGSHDTFPNPSYIEDPQGYIDLDGYNNIVPDPDGSTGYIASIGSGELVHFNYRTGNATFLPVDGGGATGLAPAETIAMSPDGRFLSIVNVNAASSMTLRNSVSIFCLSSMFIPIPFLHTGTDEFTGYGISNPSAEPMTVKAYAVGKDGLYLTGTANPAVRVLEPYAQLSFIGDQFFGLPAGVSAGWIELYCNSWAARTFFLDTDLSANHYMDGTVATNILYRDFTLTHATEKFQQNAYTVKTEISLLNPNESSITLTLTLKDPGGVTLATLANQTIKAGNMLTGTVRDLFFRGAPAVEIPAGYITGHVTESAGINGFALIRHLDPLGECLTTHSLPLTLDGKVATLYCPHIATGGPENLFPVPYDTVLHLINTAAQTAQLTLTFHPDGQAAAAPVQVELAAGQQFTGHAWQLFNLPDPAGRPAYVTGTMTVSSSLAGLIGDVIFGDGLNPSPRFQSCLALEPEGYTVSVFSHVANGPVPGSTTTYFNGISVMNPNSSQADVFVRVYRQDGILTGSNTLHIAPHARFLGLLSDPALVPASWGQIGGYVTLESASKVIAFELFIDGDSQVLSAVPRN